MKNFISFDFTSDIRCHNIYNITMVLIKHEQNYICLIKIICATVLSLYLVYHITKCKPRLFLFETFSEVDKRLSVVSRYPHYPVCLNVSWYTVNKNSLNLYFKLKVAKVLLI